MPRNPPAPPAAAARPDPLQATPGSRLREGGVGGILGYCLAQAVVTTNAVFEREVGDVHGLRPVEFTILALVHENADVSATQLARALAMTPPNVKIWLDRLEARGLVQRMPSTRDRRALHLQATPEGRALAQQTTQALVDAEHRALAGLTPGERGILLELLHKVAQQR